MPYPLPLTRTEAYLAYKAGVIQQSDLKPSLAVPRNGIDAWLAYWTGLAADYPKREDGTPHILQEEEAYIAYLCGVINEYPEKCLRRVGAYLRYLISARWGRPDHPLNREELYLSLIKTQFIPSGDPSSDIEIDGTAKAPFVDVKMYGDTFQQSYTGKNLLQLVESSRTKSGVTLTLNSDGTFGLAGTATADIEFSRTVSLAGSGIVGDQSYTISSDAPIETYGIAYYVHSVNSAGKWDKTLLGFRSAGTQTAATPSTDYIKFVVRVGNGTTVNYPSIKTMIEAGSSATDYEPFVGGQPSPNPDYPQPIQTVTGRQMVKVTGKNFLIVPTKAFTRTDGGVTWSYDPETQIYTFNGTTTADNITFGLPAQSHTIEAGSTLYTAIEYVSGSIDGALRLQSFESGYGNSAYVGITGESSVSSTKQITAESVRVIHNMRNTAVGQKFTDFKIKCYMSTVDADYQPYSSNNYEINLGKNLFDPSNYTTVHRYPRDDMSIVNQQNAWSIVVPIDGDTTYTISTTNRGLMDQYAAVGITTEDPATATGIVAYASMSGGATSATLTSPANGKFLMIYVKWSSTDATQAIANTIQIEKGSEATEFVPYFTPIELCKLGDYQDYIYENEGKWYLHKKVGKHLFDGSETFTSDGSYSGIYQYRWTDSSVLNTADQDLVGVKSDKFIGIAYRESWMRDFSIALRYNNHALRFMTSLSTTYSAFQTWLASNPTTVYYALATPTDTEITNTALIDQLDALKQGGAEDGTTYIKVSATDPNLPGLLYVEAPKYD